MAFGPVRAAGVDVGSNMLRLVTGTLNPQGVPAIEGKWVRVTRVAEGLSVSGRLEEGPIERTGRALDAFARTIAEAGIERVHAVATGAFRLAENRDEVVPRLARRLGAPIEVVSGEREAALALRGIEGALLLAGVEGPFAVLDIGGTSTEVATAGGACSIPMGVVRLTEACAVAAPARAEAWLRAHAEEAVRSLVLPPAAEDGRPAVWFVAGGAAVALAARRAGEEYLSFHGDGVPPLDRDALAAEYAAFSAEDRAVRAARLGITIEHADLVPAGWALLDAALRRFAVREIRPTGRGVAEGLVVEGLSGAPAGPATVDA